MINWDELKHIHVIRKLQTILGQWFSSEIFILDDRGVVTNFDPVKDISDIKNPVAKFFLQNGQSQSKLFDEFQKQNENALETNSVGFEFVTPDGVAKAFVVPIANQGDFLGSVIAFSYLSEPFSKSDRVKVEKFASEFDFDPNTFSNALDSLRVVNEQEKKYFSELVTLVAEEIVTYHLEITKREEQINALSSQLDKRYSYDAMIGKSKLMQKTYAMLDKIKSSSSTVLINGENGTGKELIAKSIHFNSPRKSLPFITVNCSAFNDNLLDSELFGHMKGAFTGAVKDKKGLFEAADRGTLFLDEIGDMSLTMQVKLLRILQEGTFTPVGGTELRKVDVRVLAATNRDLKEMVEQGQFREDLYYRINVINLLVPSLRDRKEDIPLLLDHFLVDGCKEKGLPLKTFAKRALEKLFDYPWPGNVRELENEVERLIVLTGDEKRITVDKLSQRIRDFGAHSKVKGVRLSGRLKDALEELEKTMIKEGLRRTNWNKSRLAKELGISRAGLIMKVDKYGLDKRKIAKAAGGE